MKFTPRRAAASGPSRREYAPVDLVGAGDARKRHGDADLSFHDFEQPMYGLSTGGTERIGPGATQQYTIGPEREHAHRGAVTRHFTVGITKLAPSRRSPGQRVVTVLRRV